MNEYFRPNKCDACKFCYRALNFGEWHYCIELHRALSSGFVEFTTPDDCPLVKSPSIIDKLMSCAIDGHQHRVFTDVECAEILSMMGIQASFEKAS
jgi:hypothetical protein